MKNYIAVLGTGPNNWSAHVPDLSGCVAAGMTRGETGRLILEAMEFHVEGLLIAGVPLPGPRFHSDGGHIAVAVVA